jgi:hypothetical protein
MNRKIASIFVFIMLIVISVFALQATFASEEPEPSVNDDYSNGSNCCTLNNNVELANSCCGGSLSSSNSGCGNVRKVK